MQTANDDTSTALTGSVTTEFVCFVIPSVLGLLAFSSAGVIDAFFIGNFVGSTALASVNLAVPLLTLVFGLTLMVSIGGTVATGKSLGERDKTAASNTFTKTMVALILLSGALAIPTLIFTEAIVRALGAKNETIELTVEYIWVVAWFFPLIGLAIWLMQFVRVDGRPGLTFIAMLSMTIVNVILDYLLIAWLDWQLTGAALATGLSYVSAVLLLVAVYFRSDNNLKLIRPYGPWLDVVKNSYNGFSELVNETSSGLILLLFNWILITQVGAMGVAAFTIVDYLIYFGILAFYGASEGLVPLVSINLGGGKPQRIAKFVGLGVGLNVLIGIGVIACLITWPTEMISVFLKDDEPQIISLAGTIILIVLPMFLFNGVNIAITGYFTGMELPTQSAVIATLRSLILPVILIVLFWRYFGFMGAFYALPISELITFCVALYLLRGRLPRHIMSRRGISS